MNVQKHWLFTSLISTYGDAVLQDMANKKRHHQQLKKQPHAQKENRPIYFIDTYKQCQSFSVS